MFGKQLFSSDDLYPNNVFLLTFPSASETCENNLRCSPSSKEYRLDSKCCHPCLCHQLAVRLLLSCHRILYIRQLAVGSCFQAREPKYSPWTKSNFMLGSIVKQHIIYKAQAFFVRNQCQSLQRKCATRQFWCFENEFLHFENEFQPF